MSVAAVFGQAEYKDHPERPGLINISRARLVLLLGAPCGVARGGACC